jgi:hypothetical protein
MVPIFIGLFDAPQNARDDGHINLCSGCIALLSSLRRSASI